MAWLRAMEWGMAAINPLIHSRRLRVLLLIALSAGGYYWLGLYVLFAALIAFMLWELFMSPRRYRKFGLGQIQQAVDNRFGIFGRSYREDEIGPEFSPEVGRNDPCPCGSGLKFKRCCGLDLPPGGFLEP